ncbi:amidase domain-containing protein [Alkaliphilus transvaalensis]|uniref:amidase domain-containing protein n=1 Tax=Alkaliphilus transvaalensis TaxID=114628 RepID=UPI00047EF003|nr:amidase domain-containing protein [Alkaliphilus transvaalensis]
MFILVKLKKIKLIIMTLVFLLILSLGLGFIYWRNYYLTAEVSINEDLKMQLTNKIEEILNIRNQAYLDMDIDTISNLYNKEIRNSLWAFEYEERKMNNIQKWSHQQSVEFKKINSQVVVKSGKEKGEGYSVYMLVNTEYIYTYTDEPETINSFRLGSYHTIDISPMKEDWVIIKEWYADPFMVTFNSLSEEKIATINGIILDGKEKDFSELNERRVNAVAYADKYSGAASLPEYGFQYNTKYRDYNPLGGDCANFASQILFEGGGFKKNRTWNYERGAGSRSWLNAHAFNNYMVNSGRASVIIRGSYEQVLKESYKLLPGDYVAYEKKGEVVHISVVTGTDSKGFPLVNSHNADRHRTPFDIGWNTNGIKFWLVRVHY